MEQTGTQPSSSPAQPDRSSKKIAAGLCAILLGPLGIHKFILGYSGPGIILLVSTLVIGPLITIFTCGLGSVLLPVLWILPLIEGIIYLTKSDEDFVRIYQDNKRPWF